MDEENKTTEPTEGAEGTEVETPAAEGEEGAEAPAMGGEETKEPGTNTEGPGL